MLVRFLARSQESVLCGDRPLSGHYRKYHPRKATFVATGVRDRSQDTSSFRQPSPEAPPSSQPEQPPRRRPCGRQEARKKSHHPEAPPEVKPCDPLYLLARDAIPELRQPPLSQPVGSVFPPFLSANGSALFSRQNLLLLARHRPKVTAGK